MAIPCACSAVRKADRAIFRIYEEAMEGSGLTIMQFTILRVLTRMGPSSLSAIADDMVLERTSLYRTIRPLEHMGAVEIRDAKKGRAKIARITRKGAAMMRAAEPNWRRAQDFVIRSIGRRDWGWLSRLLLAVPRRVNADG